MTSQFKPLLLLRLLSLPPLPWVFPYYQCSMGKSVLLYGLGPYMFISLQVEAGHNYIPPTSQITCSGKPQVLNAV